LPKELCNGPTTILAGGFACCSFQAVVTVIAVFVLENPEYQYLVYFFASTWGFSLGWFYPTEFGFFAVLVSPEQATEMAGLYNFCTLIISWCPPFIFTAMIEHEISLSYALLHLVTYFFISIGLLSCMPSWDRVMAEARPTEGLPYQRRMALMLQTIRSKVVRNNGL